MFVVLSSISVVIYISENPQYQHIIGLVILPTTQPDLLKQNEAPQVRKSRLNSTIPHAEHITVLSLIKSIIEVTHNLYASIHLRSSSGI